MRSCAVSLVLQRLGDSEQGRRIVKPAVTIEDSTHKYVANRWNAFPFDSLITSKQLTSHHSTFPLLQPHSINLSSSTLHF